MVRIKLKNGYAVNIATIGRNMTLHTNFRPSQYPAFIDAIASEYTLLAISNDQSCEHGKMEIKLKSQLPDLIRIESIMTTTLLPENKKADKHFGTSKINDHGKA